MKHSSPTYRRVNLRNTKSKLNGRKFKRSDQLGVRRLAMRLYESENMHPELIASSLGISARSVYRWISWFKSKGWDAFQPHKPIRKTKLNKEQVEEIVSMVVTKIPSDFGYSTSLWTRKLISEEISKRFGITLSEASVGRILRRNKVTPQKPIRKSYKQNKETVEKFKTVTFPGLVAKAKEENAQIFWLDETQATSDANIGRTWGKQGKTPIIPANGEPLRVNVIGAVDSNGRAHFMTYEGNTNSKVVMSFIEMLSKKNKRQNIYYFR